MRDLVDIRIEVLCTRENQARFSPSDNRLRIRKIPVLSKVGGQHNDTAAFHDHVFCGARYVDGRDGTGCNP